MSNINQEGEIEDDSEIIMIENMIHPSTNNIIFPYTQQDENLIQNKKSRKKKKDAIKDVETDVETGGGGKKRQKKLPHAKNVLAKNEIPTCKDFKWLEKYNWQTTRLKEIAKHYHLKISGNKEELTRRIYDYLCRQFVVLWIQSHTRGFLYRQHKSMYKYAVKIQACIRRYLVYLFISKMGPASKGNTIGNCNNSTDFMTMDPLEEIKFPFVYSLRDNDGFIYGFDIRSLIQLIESKSESGYITRRYYLKGNDGKGKGNGNDEKKNGLEIQNPFNRKIIPNMDLHVRNISFIYTMSFLWHIPILIEGTSDYDNYMKFGQGPGSGSDDSISASASANYNLLVGPLNERQVRDVSESVVRQYACEIFMKMDNLGNYTNMSWYLGLTISGLTKWYTILKTAWYNRAGISEQYRNELCLVHREAFMEVHHFIVDHSELLTIYAIQMIFLRLINRLVFTNNDVECQKMCVNYVLGALTLVNPQTARDIPWLFEYFAVMFTTR